jgi:hypothetical protein
MTAYPISLYQEISRGLCQAVTTEPYAVADRSAGGME